MIEDICFIFDKCSAPICPRDPESMKTGIWYPDEQICTAKGHGPGHPFYKLLSIQRRVKKTVLNRETCFTVKMLLKRRVARKGTEGLDPDAYINQIIHAQG